MQEKKQLRKEVMRRRDNLTYAERKKKSYAITQQFIASTGWKKAKTFFIYNHLRSEVQTDEIIRHLCINGKTICVPYVDVTEKKMFAIKIKNRKSDLTCGYMGIAEPKKELVADGVIDPESIDIALIPGVAFDNRGGRLGYGGGYYDRFFQKKLLPTKKIGLAYTTQVLQAVPEEPHDVLMDILITEERICHCLTHRQGK
ncbi:MAG: 5-formyltetrahydrofolate cyclo-ligase [Desulfobulbus propionicus]|nr:MAG: 5-formyltetrahydrofolate cyclo-ligase [Desulfobulbus propionicus]